MQPNVLVNTKKENSYLYNFNMNRFFLIHPLMSHLLKLSREGLDLEKWVDHLPVEGIEIEGHGTADKEEIRCEIQKFTCPCFPAFEIRLNIQGFRILDGKYAKMQK
jgi:hypothetical protein